MGKSTISMVMFNSYVSLPEAKFRKLGDNHYINYPYNYSPSRQSFIVGWEYSHHLNYLWYIIKISLFHDYIFMVIMFHMFVGETNVFLLGRFTIHILLLPYGQTCFNRCGSWSDLQVRLGLPQPLENMTDLRSGSLSAECGLLLAAAENATPGGSESHEGGRRMLDSRVMMRSMHWFQRTSENVWWCHWSFGSGGTEV